MVHRNVARLALRATCLFASTAALPNATAAASAAGAPPRQVIETRKEGFNSIGWATKAIGDRD